MKETKIAKEEREKFDYIRSMMGIVLILVIIGIGIYLLLSSLKVDCTVTPPMQSYCLTYNIEELNGCVREGHTGTGFLGMKDYNTEYWVCEDYGRIAERCIEWSKPSPSNLTADYKHCK